MILSILLLLLWQAMLGVCEPEADAWELWNELPNIASSITTGELLPPLLGSSAAYSSALDAMFVFGGEDADSGTSTSTTLYMYSFANQSWHFFPALSPSPPGRKWATLTLVREDANSSQFLLIGGAKRVLTWEGDHAWRNMEEEANVIWMLSVSQASLHWQALPSTNHALGPGPISMHQTLTHRNGKLYLFGGAKLGNATQQAQNTLFELTLDLDDAAAAKQGNDIVSCTWRQIFPIYSGPNALWPRARFGHGLASRQDHETMLLYGGRGDEREKLLLDLWAFDFSQERWRRLNSAGEGFLLGSSSTIKNNNMLERSHFAMHITSRNELVLFGGVRKNQDFALEPQNQVLTTNFAGRSELPSCQQAFWCAVSPTSIHRQPQERFDFAWTVREDELIIVGGAGDGGEAQVAFRDAWLMNKTALASAHRAPAEALNAIVDYSQIAYYASGAGIFLLCICICLCKRNHEDRIMRERNARNARRRALMSTTPEKGGASLAAIQALPVLPFAELAKQSETNAEHNVCNICLCEFTQTDDLVRVLACHHFYHPPCIDLWLAKHNSCPTCKMQVDSSPPSMLQVLHSA